MGYLPEIQRSQHVVRKKEEITRMRIAVEYPELEYLPKNEVCPTLSNHLWIEPGLFQYFCTARLDALDVLHRQNALAAVLLVNLRNMYCGIVYEVTKKTHLVPPFVGQIDFL